MMKNVLVLSLIIFTYSLHAMDPRVFWGSCWCDDDKNTLKEKFSRARVLLALEREADKKGWNNLTKEEQEKIEKLRFSEYEKAESRLRKVFIRCVTEDKIDAYLEITNTDPNTPLDWRVGPNENLLEFATEWAVGEQHVYTNVPCATSVIEALLRRGGNPMKRSDNSRYGQYASAFKSAFEIAQKEKEDSLQILSQLEKKEDGYYYDSKSGRQENPEQFKRVCKCADQIIELFQKYSGDISKP